MTVAGPCLGGPVQHDSNTHTNLRPSEPHTFLSVQDGELHSLTRAYPAARMLPPPLPTPGGPVALQDEDALWVLDEELHGLTWAQRLMSVAAPPVLPSKRAMTPPARRSTARAPGGRSKKTSRRERRKRAHKP